MKLGTLILNVTLINWRLFSESYWSDDDDYDSRLSKLKLLSLSDRRFIRDATFLFNLVNVHYDIDISNKLIFCKDGSTGYNLRKNDTQDLVPNFSRTNCFKYSLF